MRRLLRALGDTLLIVLVAMALAIGVLVALIANTIWLRDEDYHQIRRGRATWYSGGGFECACRYYPVGSYVLVRRGNMHLRLKVTSRGPAFWVMRRRKVVVDLTRTAFLWFEPLTTGHIDVTVEACAGPTAASEPAR